MTKKLSTLPNIGSEIEKQLNNVGIYTLDDLISVGSEEAWLKIKRQDASACINRLMALEGALQDIRWHDLSSETKNRLKKFYEENK